MNAANRRQTRLRPANPVAAARKTGIARAFARPAAADVGRLQARDRQGNPPRRDRDGGPPRPDRLVRRARPAEPGGVRADGARHPVPHLLHDQADRLRRHHDAGRGRPFPSQRPRREIHSGIRQPEGRRREQRQARSRAAEAPDDGSGPAAAHLGHHLRPHRQRPGAAALSAVAAAQPQDHQCRTRRPGRQPAADLPARRRMELQPLHRHPRPHHRSRLRQDPVRVPDRADPGAAADGRDRLPYR